jgi:hydroxyacylglutathione hydrolase
MFLGERQLQVLYTPGHTDDSISLLDLTSGFLFSGDFIYPGPLYAFLSNSNMGDYLAGAETVINQQSLVTEIYGAHRVRPPGAPKLGIDDVKDLRKKLLDIRAGEANASGSYPREYIVNEEITLLTEPEFLQAWQSTDRELNELSN